MSEPTAISRRIADCIAENIAGNYEGALLHLFPALDSTANRRRPNSRVGDRIRSFISDQEKIISAVATNHIHSGLIVNGVSFAEAIYKFGRNAMVHGGQLDPRLTFDNSVDLMIGDTWNLPPSYITAFCIAVMVAPENALGRIDYPLVVSLFGRHVRANELWGAQDFIQRLICEKFKSPHLFAN